MSENQTRFTSILLSALSYGGGFALGTLLIILLFNNPLSILLISLLVRLQLLLYLVFALLFILVIVAVGGWAGGVVGGWGLSAAVDLDNRRHFMWRSGASFALTNFLLVLPVFLLTAVVGFLNADLAENLSKLPRLFAFFGLIYGGIAGLLLGLLTVGLRKTLGIFLASLFGFGLGGVLLGTAIFIYFRLGSPVGLLVVLFACTAVFLYGAAGGGALGFAYQFIHEERSLFPDTRNWQILRNALLVGIGLFFVLVIGNLVLTLWFHPADLATSLPLKTVGTQWSAVEDAGLSSAVLESADDSGTVSCDEAGQIIVRTADGHEKKFLFPRCQTQPVLAEDGVGNLHLVWYSDQVSKVTGAQAAGHFLYESIYKDGNWSEAALVAQLSGVAEPTLNSLADGSLFLSWYENGEQKMITQEPYNCQDVPMTDLGEVVYGVVRKEEYRPASDPIPYCGNKYDQLLFTPNPEAPQSDFPSSEHGAFDRVAELVKSAEYEVLFTVMQWDKPLETSSPGSTLADAVAELYSKVKADPEAYPRGMTVRILLGNLPFYAIFEPATQVAYVMEDLQRAGLPELENEELGWKVEIANYEGAWPHAHSKFGVVDGRTTFAAGFNYSYLHLSSDHPSGLGLDMTDKGIQFTGPVAQSVLVAFDDLWSGANLVSCSRYPPVYLLRFLWCDVEEAEATHVPEVLRFYPTTENTTAFALHHTPRFLESDDALLNTILSAEDSIDLYEVNFSLDLVCILALALTDFCSVDGLAPPYMHALVTAVAENDVKLRLLLESSAFNGLENRIGIRWFLEELEKEGKLDNVEIRWFDGKMHDKAFLIDDELLIVGSQNFHYSAWESPSLTEYNIATEDRKSIGDFSNEFEFQWQKGIPIGEEVNSKETKDGTN